MQVLGKCQLREVVQEKENGLDSLGNKSEFHYKREISGSYVLWLKIGLLFW